MTTTQRSPYAATDVPAHQGVPPTRDAAHGMSPQQARVLDGEMSMTGRVNSTRATQETTADNALSIRDPALVAQDTQHWDAHRRHRQPSVGQRVRE
jgi:hypothetical protein